MKKITYEELYNAFDNANRDGKVLKGFIVFAADNWSKPFSEKERTYAVHSNEWGWDSTKLGRCRTGDCLDGKDLGVRLDYYDWRPEYCYLAE